jgi:Fe-S-cluster containining protein
MGLYLCVFDECGEDICGVEVGLYKYFAEFRQKVAIFVDDNRFTNKMPTLLQHLDCDGNWSVSDCKILINELMEIKAVFQQEPPLKEIQNLKENIFKFYGIVPKNLFECFVDTDCEFLIDRLLELCNCAIKENRPIQFQ